MKAITNFNAKKKQAIKNMKALDIFPDYIEHYTQTNNPILFEGLGGYYTDDNEELLKIVRDFEQEHNSIVYAITHEKTEFGEMYDFFHISNYKEEWEEDYIALKNRQQDGMVYPFVYVYNKSQEEYSEFGTIVAVAYYGVIKRID